MVDRIKVTNPLVLNRESRLSDPDGSNVNSNTLNVEERGRKAKRCGVRTLGRGSKDPGAKAYGSGPCPEYPGEKRHCLSHAFSTKRLI